MDCVSYDLCVYHPWFVFFPRSIPQLQSDWSLSCDTGLIMRVNVTTCMLTAQNPGKNALKPVVIFLYVFYVLTGGKNSFAYNLNRGTRSPSTAQDNRKTINDFSFLLPPLFESIPD